MKKCLIVVCAMLLCLTMVMGIIPTAAAENKNDDVVFEAHYYMPNNGVEPVVLEPVTYGDLSGSQYTTITFELSPEDCDKYFSAMTERNSIEFQLRTTGSYGYYINGISWGFKGETPASDLSGDSLKAFFTPNENTAEHTDFRINGNTQLDETRLAWDATENAAHLKSADSSLLDVNAIWGMELREVRGAGKTAVLTFSVKLDALKDSESNPGQEQQPDDEEDQPSAAIVKDSSELTKNGKELVQIHYYIPDNGEEPVVFPAIYSGDLSTSEYTTITFALTPEDCEEYFSVMTERNSIEFQLRITGAESFYVSEITWGFEGETPENKLSGEALKSFVWEGNTITHTELANTEILTWHAAESAYQFSATADTSIVGRNSLWGMELHNVRDSGKTAVFTITLKSAEVSDSNDIPHDIPQTADWIPTVEIALLLIAFAGIVVGSKKFTQKEAK